MQLDCKLTIMYDLVGLLKHSTLRRDKADVMWNINTNTPVRSMKGTLLLFKKPDGAFGPESETFYNSKSTFLACTIEGVPNHLFPSGMRPYQHFGEVRQAFGGGRLNCPVVNEVNKVDQLADVDVDEYFTANYAFWLDLRTSDDDAVHGNGRTVDNG